MSRPLVLALTAALATTACYRPPPPPNGAAGNRAEGERDADARYEPPPLSEAARLEAERLKSLGPVYTPYERGPRLIWDEAAQRALVETLAPVVEERRLPIRTQALLWVLVRADGLVVDAVVQTSSSRDAFDRAALELARKLRFVPATTDGKPVPVWVIREISLLMQ